MQQSHRIGIASTPRHFADSRLLARSSSTQPGEQVGTNGLGRARPGKTEDALVEAEAHFGEAQPIGGNTTKPVGVSLGDGPDAEPDIGVRALRALELAGDSWQVRALVEQARGIVNRALGAGGDASLAAGDLAPSRRR